MIVDTVVRIEYNESGLPVLIPTPGCRLTAAKHGNSFTIKGNREGLLLLARSLIGLAQMPENEANRGYHIHLDDLYEINDQGVDVLVALDETPTGLEGQGG
ncbi:hypothetical protein WMF45_11605 [Sorangium sp. So ce448]|uniref:Imm32 family immunity protein n=1 Tax=Sorangium sp. So ce448 TaxID=3133314 RepID=UPI003F5FE565